MRFKHLFVSTCLALAVGLGIGSNSLHFKTIKTNAASDSEWGDNLYVVGDPTAIKWDFTLNLGDISHYNSTTSRYEVTFSATAGQYFRFKQNADWNTGFNVTTDWWNDFDEDNFLKYVGKQDGGDKNFKFLASGTYTLYWAKGSNPTNICSEIGLELLPEPHDYSLACSWTNPAWDATIHTYDFVVSGNQATATLSNQSFQAGYEFKIVEDHGWDTSYGYDQRALFSKSESVQHAVDWKDGNVLIREPGTYTITLTINTSIYAVTAISISGTVNTVYTVTFGETVYNLARNTDGGYDAQYTGTVSVVAGQTPVFKKSSSTITATADPTYNENINTATGQVLETANNISIWLHVTVVETVETYSFWLDGRLVDYYISVGGTLHPMSENTNNPGEYMATSISVAENDFVRFYSGELFDASVSGSAGGTWNIVDGKIKAGEGGTFNFYLTPGETNTVYIDNLSAADMAAIQYAELFLGTLQDENTPICVDESLSPGQHTNLSDLQDAWSDLKDAFDDITVDGAKGVLRDASRVGDGKVNKFAALYDHIVAAYKTQLGQNYNFVGRSEIAGRSVILPINTNNSLVIVTITISVSLLALGGFFLLKKKKEN